MMNRIVLIGNGFDKAHKLLTGYDDFLNHLKDSVCRYERVGNKRPSLISVNSSKCGNQSNFHHRNIDGKKDKWIGVMESDNCVKLATATCNQQRSIYFKSLFQEFEQGKNWSDLESHYFKVLYDNKSSSNNINIINSEFAHLKSLLSDYLNNEIEGKIDNDIKFTDHAIYQKLKLTQSEFEKTYFVTFNYTSKILDQYYYSLSKYHKKQYPLPPIHIHGDLTNSDNPIIFGYGDENSSQYKELELLLNNVLLVNFKTFQYSRSNRYKEVLGLLEESNDIRVEIIGSSCGMCDKTLLRAIFQHENVKSIEATYYNDESNYFENLYNISRTFDDNTTMRNKIIPLQETFKI